MHYALQIKRVASMRVFYIMYVTGSAHAVTLSVIHIW